MKKKIAKLKVPIVEKKKMEVMMMEEEKLTRDEVNLKGTLKVRKITS